MTNYKNKAKTRKFPYTHTERMEFFESKMKEKAEAILNESYPGFPNANIHERVALIRVVREFYLDRDNYPRAFNLRIARRFDSSELDSYMESAKNGYRKFFDTTVYSSTGTFYFGFNHN